MKKIIIVLLNIVLVMSMLSFTSLSDNNVNNQINKPNQAGPLNSFPLGSASFDFEFVVSQEMTQSNGPTDFSGTNIGKTIYYDLNIKNFPLKEILSEYVDSNFSVILNNFDLNQSQLFFKVLNEDAGLMDVIFGFKLGKDIVLDFSSVIPSMSTNQIPAFLQSLLIPKDLTFTFPVNVYTEKFLGLNSRDNSCSWNSYCPPISDMTFYLDPSDWVGHDTRFGSLLDNLTIESNMTRVSWMYLSEQTLPPQTKLKREYQSSSFLLDNVTISGGKITTGVPYQYIEDIFNASGFDPDITNYSWDYSNFYQPIGVYFNSNYKYNSESSYDFTNNKKSEITFDSPLADGTQVMVVYSPDRNVYANGGVVTLPNANITDVHGVYASDDISWTSYLQIPPSTTNFYTGGSFTNTSITLGTDPGPNKKLVVFYTDVEDINDLPTFGRQYTPGQSFNLNISASSQNEPLAEFLMEFSWDLANPDPWFDGWMNDLYFNLSIDIDNSSVIDADEYIELSLVLNQTASYQTPNPLALGDQGIYKIKRSSLVDSYTGDFSFLADLATGGQGMTDVKNTLNSMNGKKLFNYTVTGIDGLYYSMNGTLWDPTDNNNMITGGVPELAFSTFNGYPYLNYTETNDQWTTYLWDLGINDLEMLDYYSSYFPLTNGTYTRGNSGQVYAMENITITQDYLMTLGAPHRGGYIYFFNVSDYDYAKSPSDQNFSNMFSENFDSFYSNNTNVIYDYWADLYNDPSGPLSAGNQYVVFYRVDDRLNANNGVVNLPDSVKQVNGVYYNDYNKKFGFDETINLLDNGGSLTNNVITLGSNDPYPSGMYRIRLDYTDITYDGHHFYVSPMPALGGTEIFTAITPARTTDFGFTEDNVNSFNRIVNDKITPALAYLEDLLQTQLQPALYGNLTFEAALSSQFNDLGATKSFMVNASLSTFIPFKYDGFIFKFNTEFVLNADIGFWTIWDSNGILQETGIKIQADLVSAAEFDEPIVINPGQNEIVVPSADGTTIGTTISLTTTGSTEVTITVSDAVVGKQDQALDDQSSEFKVAGYFIDINVSDPSVLSDIWVNISYADWDLTALGLNEDDLQIYYYDEGTSTWLPAGNTGVDKSRKIIYANLDHLTAFAAVAVTPPDDSTPSSGPDDSTSSQEQIAGTPGFELVFGLLAIGVIVSRRKFRK